ncbi:hypothetical protein H4R24_001542 [Coemansia sp. RSA 988]|nr:hypothetical protein H4R24_001542 [Coemansia sp. RSA 988]
MTRVKSSTTTTAAPAASTTKVTKSKVSKASKGTKGTKKMSSYNKYMKNEISKVKNDNPGLTHKEAFKMVALSWKTAPENPKVIAAK